MGEKLRYFYKEAKEKGGLEAQIKLALITKISSVKAYAMADTPENLKIFENAFLKIFHDSTKEK